MSLRSRNAAQTRALILDAALDLFVGQGYDATKMEEVAERAEVSASTLYRYFPCKDLLLIEPLALNGQMAAELRVRPTAESLDLALGHALRALIATPRPDAARLKQLWEVVQSAPSVQTRLLEEFVRERVLLGEAIAERIGRPAEDIFCQTTARLTTSVLEMISAHRDGGTARNVTAAQEAVEFLRGILNQMRHEPPVLPRID